MWSLSFFSSSPSMLQTDTSSVGDDKKFLRTCIEEESLQYDLGKFKDSVNEEDI